VLFNGKDSNELRSAKALEKYWSNLDPKCHDPEPVQVRKRLIRVPQVRGYLDFENGDGMIRILDRMDGSFFPELAIFMGKAKPPMNRKIVSKFLVDAGFTKETHSKHVLRTNKFNIFVYL